MLFLFTLMPSNAMAIITTMHSELKNYLFFYITSTIFSLYFNIQNVMSFKFFKILNNLNLVLRFQPKMVIFIKICYLLTLMPSSAVVIIIIITSTSSPILTGMCYMQDGKYRQEISTLVIHRQKSTFHIQTFREKIF